MMQLYLLCFHLPYLAAFNLLAHITSYFPELILKKMIRKLVGYIILPIATAREQSCYLIIGSPLVIVHSAS